MMMAPFTMFVSQFFFLAGTSLAMITPQLVTMAATEKDYFTAAVYEHVKLGNWTDNPAEVIDKNLDYYSRATEIASSKGADIIVFPEYGFFYVSKKREDTRLSLETIPDHKSAKWNPCRQTEEFSNRPILRRLSCMARQNQIVLVTSMGDVQPCTKGEHPKCPDDGFWQFNALVAFDRDGTLIGVSRKEHLFFEDTMDFRPASDPVFTTDFGTFAMYICFDAMFKSMALAGRNTSISAVILSPMWFDYRPLTTFAQYHSSFAIGSGANLIVSNVKIPGWITTGSGVFAGKMGALKYTSNIDSQAKLIVSRLPKNRNQDRNAFRNDEASITVITSNGTRPYDVDEDEEGRSIPDVCYYKLLGQDANEGERCFQEPMANYTFKKLTGRNGVVKACNNGLCCSATYDAVSMDESFYLGVFNGSHNAFDRYFWCKEVCFIVRCDRFNGSECNTFPAHSGTVFRKLELKMNLTTEFVYPSVLKSGFRLAPVNEWNFSVVKHNDSYSGRLTYESDSEKPMVNAAIRGRCYDRDPPFVN